MKASDVSLDNGFCAKTEVLLLKVGISEMSLILHCLSKGQMQTSGGTERGAQGALTGETVEQDGTSRGDRASPPVHSACPTAD